MSKYTGSSTGRRSGRPHMPPKANVANPSPGSSSKPSTSDYIEMGGILKSALASASQVLKQKTELSIGLNSKSRVDINKLTEFLQLEYELQGSIYNKTPDLHGAIVKCTTGLKTNKKSIPLLAERCKSYLELRCFRRALEDSRRILQVKSDDMQGIYFQIKALFGLDKVEEALNFIGGYTKSVIYKENKLIFKELIKKAELYLHQQETGDYDMAYFFKRHDILHHECADYLGPVVLKKLEGKGRGCVATGDIKAGQLVMVSKALMLLYEESSHAVEEKRRLLVHENELLPFLYNLYAGPTLSYIPPNQAKPKLDHQRMLAVIRYNIFASTPKPHSFYDCEDRATVHGIWYIPSFINHSCFDSNCFWEVFGGIMFVRALKDIKAGDEILISYLSLLSPYEKRFLTCKSYGFECHCTLCKVDRIDFPLVQKGRSELLEVLSKLSCQPEISISTVKELIGALKYISGERKHPVYLVNPYTKLGFFYFKEGNHEESAKAMEKAYEIISATPIMPDFGLPMIGRIIHELLTDGQPKCVNRAKEWVEKLKESAVLVYGSNAINVIRETAFELMEKLAQYEIEL